MRNIRSLRLSALLLALLTALGAITVFAKADAPKKTEDSLMVYSTSFGRSRLIPDEEGVYSYTKQAPKAQVGENEHLLAALMASPSAPLGETAVATFSSKGYDFSQCAPVLIIPADGTYYTKKLSDFTAAEDSLSVKVRVEYLGINSDSPVYLYLAPEKITDSDTIKLTVTRFKTEQFDFGETIVLGDYYIQKQGGIMPLEIALGMANMDEQDIVYLVSDKTGAEVLRLVMHDDQLYGIARKENGLVISLEYNFKKKAYVSVLSGTYMLSKETVMDVFSQLGISFTNPPDEYDWLWRQKLYSSSKKIRLRAPDAEAAPAAEQQAQQQ